MIYKKFEVFRVLTDEINFLVETFREDKAIDDNLLDTLCKLFIESQNVLSNICPYVRPSYHKKENFINKNEVNKFINITIND